MNDDITGSIAKSVAMNFFSIFGAREFFLPEPIFFIYKSTVDALIITATSILLFVIAI